MQQTDPQPYLVPFLLGAVLGIFGVVGSGASLLSWGRWLTRYDVAGDLGALLMAFAIGAMWQERGGRQRERRSTDAN